MAGMLTVVNPRRKRRHRTKRARGTTKRRRRRRHLFARAANPIRRRRRRGAHRRVHARRRRRHSNPAFRLPGMGSGAIGDVMKGITGAGVGAIIAKVLGNAVNNTLLKGNPQSGLAKVGVQAAAGVVGAFVLGKFLKQRALAVGVATGAGVVIALELYDMYIHPNLPGTLQDYQYGSLNDYQYGSLNGWAPQGGAELSGANVYEDTVYGGGA